MSFYGPDYDRWLESEKDRVDAESDSYVQWCEEQDPPMDPESEAALEAWEDFKEEESRPDPDDIRDEALEMIYEDRFLTEDV